MMILRLKMCQDTTSPDLGVYAFVAKDNVDCSFSLSTSSSGRSVSEAFSLCKGETATSSSNTGEGQDRTRADLLLLDHPVHVSSVIFSSTRALRLSSPPMQFAGNIDCEAEGPCPSLPIAPGYSFVPKEGNLGSAEASVNIPDSKSHIQSESYSNVKSSPMSGESSATRKQYASFTTSVLTTDKYGFASTKYGFSHPRIRVNSWGIPCGLGLVGGGESAANGWGGATSQAPNWGPNSNQNAQGHWPGNNRNSGPQGSEIAANIKSNPGPNAQNANGSQNSGQIPAAQTQAQANSAQQQSQPPTSNGANAGTSTWAQAAGKGLPSATSDVQKLQSIKEALLSSEGWGGENVNQESAWDIPPSPEPSKDAATPHWKIVVNNGCDLWETNLRNGGVAPPKVQQAPWGKDPIYHFGGTWGEDDEAADSSNAWINTPNTPTTPGANYPQQSQQNMWMTQQKKGHDWVAPNSNWDHPSRPEGQGEWPAHKPGPPVGPPMGSHQNTHPGAPLPPGHPGPHPSSHPSHPNTHPSHPSLHPGSHNLSHPSNHPTPLPATHQAPPPHNAQHSVPHQSTHVPPGPLGNNRWNSGAQKDAKATGWEDASPPPIRRDDGTAIWGKPNQSANVSHWKEAPNQQHMMNSMRPNPMQSRLPAPSIPGPMKTDQRMWGQQGRNGNWSDGAPDIGSQVWSDESKQGGWEPPITSPSWSKPKANNWDSDFNDMNPWGSHNKSGGGNSQQVRALMNHIQLAVQAGYLNPQILNQPLAPNTLLLLNHMLSMISLLHKLLHQQSLMQPQAHLNKSTHGQLLSLNAYINKVKGQIQNYQSQITAQQTMYMKQPQATQSHIPNLSVGGPGGPPPQNDYKGGIPDIYSNFAEMSISDSPGIPLDPPGSRLSSWKQGTGDQFGLNEFVRTPGKPTVQQSSPNYTPIISSNSSTWSSNTRPNESGWPDTTTSLQDGSGADKSLPGLDSPWSSQSGSYGLDIKPFEPGKPWMMKNIEDDPTVTPGSVIRSPLSLGVHDSELLKTPTTSSELTTLNSNTWTFNPNSGPQNTNSPLAGDSKLVGSGSRPKGSWSEANSQNNSDLWGGKSRGPPPGLAKGVSGSGSWGAIGRSTSWSGEQRNNNSALNTTSTPSWNASQISTWLILKNLTPQIDGSTLKTLCLQHGPLINFHLSLNHGFALVNYGSKEEAVKAQGNLNNCLLSNTTILAEFASDTEVNQVLGGAVPSNQSTVPTTPQGPNPSWSGSTPTSQTSSKDSWGSSSLWGPPTSGSLWSGAALDERATPSSLKSYLPDGLLNSESM